MSALKKILIKTKRAIFSEVPANNPSIYEGEGFDFVELREYTYGDDVRKIDWNVTAKKQTPYIRVFREERELNIAVVSLMGGSIYFGKKRLKQELMAEVVALLGFGAVKNSDRFSLYHYDSKLEVIVRPNKSINSVTKAVDSTLTKDVIGKKIDAKNISKHLYETIKRRSIIFIVGDFFEEFDFKLLSKKHEVVAIITRDKLEENPPDIGNINLLDPSSLKSMMLDLNQKKAKEYQKRVAIRDHKMYERFRKDRVAFTKIYTDENPYVKLTKLFLKR